MGIVWYVSINVPVCMHVCKCSNLQYALTESACHCNKEIISDVLKCSETLAFCSRPSEDKLQCQYESAHCSIQNKTQCPWMNSMNRENKFHLLPDGHIVLQLYSNFQACLWIGCDNS